MPASEPSPSWLARATRRIADFCRMLLVTDDPRQQRVLAVLTVLLVLSIGIVDFLLPSEISLHVFYFLPVLLAVAARGWRFGVVIAFASVGTWIAGDMATGVDYTTRLIPWWNAGIALGTYLVIVWLFNIVRMFQREMEARVRERTAALTAEITERERLEKEVLAITERERRLIGHDLHDGLGQHLTGTAFAGQVLCEKLASRNLPEEETDAWKIVHLVEDGIEKTRQLARGLLLAEIKHEGLLQALQELATSTTSQFRVACRFEASGDCEVGEDGAATHLLRIAQEAVRNAIRHGGARLIEIRLRGDRDALELTVKDNGKGLPVSHERGGGLGLRIMAHRAQIIRGEFAVAACPPGGTVVTCRLKRSPAS